eukprot:SAG31_NODE_9385_length_1286_cov_1.122999_2_plen_140_part_01
MTTCVCDRDYYNASLSTIECYELGQRFDTSRLLAIDECVPCEALDCIVCELGSTALKPDHSLSSTPIATGKGLMQIESQRAVYPCPSPGTCTGDLIAPCSTSTTGPLCSVCADGYSHPGLDGECEPCSDTISMVWIVMGG